MAQDRYERGIARLREMEGDAGKAAIESLKDISPDLERYLVEFVYGDVYSRGGLTLKHKEIAAVSALVAMGNAAPQLKTRLNGALNAGCSLDEVSEVILQMSAYAGFPAAINAMKVLKEVVLERNGSGHEHGPAETAMKRSRADRYETGVEWLSKLDPNIVRAFEDEFESVMPDIARYTIEYGYGDVYSRQGLVLKSRQMATISAVAALGTAPVLLRFHINCGLNVGLTEQEIMEVMTIVSVYAGFPAALNGAFAAKEVFENRGRDGKTG
jgi:4-carboxymuconolactone decarboxylase